MNNYGKLGLLVLGAVLCLIMVSSISTVNHVTSTDQFCGNSCHSMKFLSEDPVYINSAHRKNSSGVVAGCKDCHLPKEFIAETWAHIHSGTKDLIATMANDYSKIENWEPTRQALAHQVREDMVENDSKNCRYCHQTAFQQPRQKRVSRQHELAERQGVTCIQCHYNLVHQFVKPAPTFITGNNLIPDYTRKQANNH